MELDGEAAGPRAGLWPCSIFRPPYSSLSGDVPNRVCIVNSQTVSAKTSPTFFGFRSFILNLLPARWQHRCVMCALGISLLLARIRVETPASSSDSTSARGARAGRPAARGRQTRTVGRRRSDRRPADGPEYSMPARPDSNLNARVARAPTAARGRPGHWQPSSAGPATAVSGWNLTVRPPAPRAGLWPCSIFRPPT